MALEGYTIKDIEKVITGIDGKKAIQVDISRLTAPGENYVSLVFGVDILVEDEGGTRETIKAVAKRLPLVEIKGGMSIIPMKQEIKFYCELLPLLNEFATKYGITTDYYPRHLGSRLSLDPTKTEPDSESILLVENLLPQGYFNEDRFTGFDLEAAKAILKVLAQFHGIPLAIKFKNPELFEVIKKIIDYPPFPGPPEDGSREGEGPPEKLLFEGMLKVPALEPYMQKVKKLQENLPPIKERFHGKGEEPWNTLSHNDFWVNNMLIKLPGKDSPRHLVKLLDFQMCSYSSFAKDLVFFLLTSVRDDVQRKHLDDLLRYYYEELTALLAKIDVPELKFSYDEYMEEITLVAKKFEIFHSLFFCNIIFAARGSQKDHLTGEVDVFDQLNAMMSNLGERQAEKIGLVLELCVGKGWMAYLRIVMSLVNYSIKDIEKVLKLDGNKRVLKVNIERLTAPGENYVSLVFRVDFHLDNNETIHAVAKRLPLGQGSNDLNVIAMRNEIRWFSEVVPLIEEFSGSCGLEGDYFPKYLGSRFSLDRSKIQADSEALLMTENLNPQGYINEDRLKGFDLETSKAVLKALAEFHAVPLAAKFKKPDLAKTIRDFLASTVPLFPEPPAKEGLNDFVVPELLVLNKTLEIPACQDYVKNLKHIKKNFATINQGLVGPALEPWSTISHNDFWTNNIMVKPQKNGKTLVKILDFQVCIYTSYARDVIFFLLTSLQDDVQRRHLDSLLRYYYDELTSTLSKIDVPELKLSYEDYLAEIKRVMIKYEAIHVLFFCSMIYASKNNHADHLTGETNMYDHIIRVISNMSERAKEKIALAVELSVERGWM
ncbi:uncharacterized protein [Euwallacea fornicatus]|uniref:uncharacterized protein n=1 Tax=Euwallacea fornicatus TaxID=995702 RepID=UPI00338DA4C2